MRAVRVRRLTPKTKHRDCQKDPCALCRKREHQATCGECRAGIRLREVKLANGNKATVVEKCDVCLLLDDSDPIYHDAPAVVGVLLDMLDVEYASGDGSVADACERILDLVKSAAELRENFRQADAVGAAARAARRTIEETES